MSENAQAAQSATTPTTNAANVSAAKPKVGGALWKLPASGTLPTDATADLPTGSVSLGYISDAGAVNSVARESQDIKAWGGDTVYTAQTGKTDQWTIELIEVLSDAVQKFVHGDDNVSGSIDAGMTIKENALELTAQPLALETILAGDIAQRIVIPRGKVTNVGDITYADGSIIKYPVTITAEPDTSGNTHYTYLKKKGSS